MARISVVIPVYNAEAYLDQCVESVLSQTFSDLEIILVNDGSTDGSGMKCDFYKNKDKRIKVVHKNNGGLSSARNIGIENSSGEYIGFIDSDDWVSCDMYDYLYRMIRSYKADVSSIAYTVVNGREPIFAVHNCKRECIINMQQKEAMRYYLKAGMEKVNDYSVCTKLYKAELFNKIRFPDGRLYEDMGTNFSILSRVQSYVKSNRICYYYYYNMKSITKSRFSLKQMDVFIACDGIEEICKNRIKDEYLISLSQLVKARAALSLLGKILIKDDTNNNYSNEKKLMLKSVRANAVKLFFSRIPFALKNALIILLISPRLYSRVAKKYMKYKYY